MKITLIGAAGGDVTGSCYWVETNQARILIDCGLFQGGKKSYGDRPPVKSAILATDTTITHYCPLHAIITEDSPINVRIFQKREDAAKWLGVPIDRLALKFATG